MTKFQEDEMKTDYKRGDITSLANFLTIQEP